MDFKQIYNQLITDFNLQDLEEADREEMLIEIAKTIQKQFLLDIYEITGEKNFEALQASANMGEEFYGTTLRHLVPNCNDVFLASIAKVVKAFRAEE